MASSLATDGGLRDNEHVRWAAVQPTVRWKRGGDKYGRGHRPKNCQAGVGGWDGMGLCQEVSNWWNKKFTLQQHVIFLFSNLDSFVSCLSHVWHSAFIHLTARIWGFIQHLASSH